MADEKVTKSGAIFETVEEPTPPVTSPSPVLKPEELTASLDNDQLDNLDSGFTDDEPVKPRFPRIIMLGIGAMLVLILLVTILSAVFGKKKQQAVTLTYWGLWEDAQTLQPIFDAYKKEHPNVTIKYEKKPSDQYLSKLLARIQSGEGPDIFRFHNSWVPILTKDVLAPAPASVITLSQFEKTFYASHVRDLIVGKSIVGMPTMIDGLVLIYNPKLLQAVGVVEPPKEWDTFLSLAKKLTVLNSDGQVVTSGLAIGTANNVEHFSDIYAWILLQDGIKTLDDLTAAKGGTSLHSYRALAEPDTNVWSSTLPNDIRAFAQEKVAMIMAPSWEILRIRQINPDISIKTAALPALPGGKPVSVGNYWVEGVSKRSANQVEAWKFLNYLSSNEAQTMLFEAQSKTRLFGTAYARKDLSDTLKNNQYLSSVVAMGDSYYTLPLIQKTWDGMYNDSLAKYVENAINESATGVSYEESAKKIELGIQEVKRNLKLP